MAKPVLRFCHGVADDIDPDSPTMQLPRFTQYETLAYSSWNSSHVKPTTMQECLELMIRNETDISQTTIEYPLLHESLKHLPVSFESRMMIISSYERMSTASRREVVRAFSGITSFSSASLITITALSLCIFVLLKISSWIIISFKYQRATGKSLKRKQFWKFNTSAQYESSTASKVVIHGWLKQFQSCGRIDAKTAPFRFLVLIFAVLVLWIHFFIVSYIKTGLVVTGKPDSIESYADVLKRPKMQPYWLPYVTDFLVFQRANPDSYEGRIWRKATQMKPSCARDASDCLFELNAKNTGEFTMSISRGEAVMIACDVAANIVHAGLCPMARMIGANPVINRADPRGKRVAKCLVYNKYIDKQVERVLYVRSRRTLESGITLFLMICTTSPLENMVNQKFIRDCFKNEVISSDSHIDAKRLDDYYDLIVFSSLSIFAALIMHVKHLTNYYRRKQTE